ncbi:hypothetical protein J1771_gp10 [Gordonia phage MelBins]|uniref:Uncharacterized protein n=1 Tax=Gordonia phage MelBins TaxID=2656540 RepID=A0A649VN06_9CAUD|nr:hypothetical protein J1771_gp10 [Gordonia phage MelBins]QGJ93564.1 hypothetical protein SEA_MELBINS_10 [Gordonia phage MelBins]
MIATDADAALADYWTAKANGDEDAADAAHLAYVNAMYATP